MDMATTKTAFTNGRRQKAVIECHGSEWWAMTPYGDVHVCASAADALGHIQTAALKGNRGVTFTTVEWRNVPVGFVPPGGSK
jgi:hypothetical protein